MKVYPSLMAADFGNLAACVSVLDTLADVGGYHLDVMDNHFVPNFTFGPLVAGALQKYVTKPFEAHLMVQNPLQHFDQCAQNGVAHVFTHIENTPDISDACAKARGCGMGYGLVINPETPFGQAREYLCAIDSLLVMTVNPGFCGQIFMNELLPKIDEALYYRSTRNPLLRIVVDGGVNAETAPALHKRGVEEVVVGSYMFKDISLPDAHRYKARIRSLYS
ncbi:MAG: ribulose-phosphate 3-epimerase [Alphaproteobacteria bacterium]|nr:MAG: ribulose-phosphate 3-epimerase [Alphaproteobacteria bacterium]